MQDAVVEAKGEVVEAASPFRSSSELEHAFQAFSQMSEKLSVSYRELEHRVASLSGELAQVSAQRMHELSEKERLASRLENLLDLLPGGVIVLDGAGRVQQTNPAAREILGRDLRDQRWVDIIAQVFAPRGDDGHEVSLRNGRRVGIATASLGHEPGQIILLTDLTETRHLQEALSRHERLSAMGRMVASLAHQVRTPLSAALLYCGHLCDAELDDAQRRRFAMKVRERLERLEQQVRDMLLFARGETTLSNIESAATILHGVRSVAEPLIARKKMQLSIKLECPEVRVHCNRETLIGALLNLVENAMHVCPAGANIEICARIRNDQVVFCVTDQGPGMTAAELQQAREPFYTTKDHGTGLGLAVVQSVARSHQGFFELESNPGKGTSAALVLPQQSASQATEEVA